MLQGCVVLIGHTFWKQAPFIRGHKDNAQGWFIRKADLLREQWWEFYPKLHINSGDIDCCEVATFAVISV